MRLTIGCGVPLMARWPYQVETIQLGTPISVAVGMSGNSAVLLGCRRCEPQKLAGLDLLRRGAHAVEHHVGVAGQQVLHRRSRAAIGHVGDVGLCLEPEQLARQVVRRAGAGRGVVHFARILLHVLDQLDGGLQLECG